MEQEKEKKKNNKGHKLKKFIAGVGAAITIISFIPEGIELTGYALKKTHSFAYSTVTFDNTNEDEFINQFSIAINKNSGYNEIERQVIIKGVEKYINDWGYLLNDTDKKHILYIAENVKINRNVWQPRWASGSYYLNNINLVGDGVKSTVAHESAHAFSDRGIYVGTIENYGFGYALNEGINTSINDKYITKDFSYRYQCDDVFKISLLVDNEVIMKAYQKNGASYICKMASKNSNINYMDMVIYIAKMDLQIFFDHKKVIPNYKLPKGFNKEKNELYNKMFKDKYGYDFSESVMANVQTVGLNFLDEKIECYKYDGFKKYSYLIPKELLIFKSADFDYEKYFVKESIEFKFTEAHNFLATIDDIEKFNSFDEFCINFSSKLENPEAELESVKLVFSQAICEENFEYYMKYIGDKILHIEKSPEYVACYIKKVYDALKNEMEIREQDNKIDNFEERFNTIITNILKENNMNEIIELYKNSDIEFEKFSYESENCILPDEYNILKKSDNYIVNEQGLIVLKVPSGEGLYSAKYKDDYIHFFEIKDEELINSYNNSFGTSDGIYYYAYIQDEQVNIQDINITTHSVIYVNNNQNYK